MVDSRQVAAVADGETAALETSAGPHRVRLAIDWSGSREVCASPNLDVTSQHRDVL
jgi:hypothetical protein